MYSNEPDYFLFIRSSQAQSIVGAVVHPVCFGCILHYAFWQMLHVIHLFHVNICIVCTVYIL